jgi:hypothetical protein
VHPHPPRARIRSPWLCRGFIAPASPSLIIPGDVAAPGATSQLLGATLAAATWGLAAVTWGANVLTCRIERPERRAERPLSRAVAGRHPIRSPSPTLARRPATGTVSILPRPTRNATMTRA